MIVGVLPNSGLFQLVLFLHILCAVVGFGSTFVWPMLSVKARQQDDPGFMLKVTELTTDVSKVQTSPFIYASGAFGLLLVIFGATEDPAYWEFSDTWITIAMTLYIVALGVALGLHYPNLKRMLELQREMAAGGPSQGGPPPQVAELQDRGKKAGMYGGILHLLFAVILLDMVVKFGS